jgi:WD40 repeat protein
MIKPLVFGLAVLVVIGLAAAVLATVAHRAQDGTPTYGLLRHDPGDAGVFSPDGSLLAAVDHDTTVVLWDVATQQRVRECELPAPEQFDTPRALAFSHSGSELYAADVTSRIAVWDTTTGVLLRTFTSPITCIANDIALSPDDTTLAIAHHCFYETSYLRPPQDRLAQVSLLDAVSGAPTIDMRTAPPELRGPAITYALDFGPDGRNLLLVQVPAVIMGNDGTLDPGTAKVAVWNLESNTSMQVSDQWFLTGDLSADGTLIAAGDAAGDVYVWSAVTGEQLYRLEGYDKYAESVAFSPDGSLLASGGGQGHNTVIVWDVATGTLLHRLKGHGVWSDLNFGIVWSLDWSPDGSILASSSDDGLVILWNPLTGDLVAPAPR